MSIDQRVQSSPILSEPDTEPTRTDGSICKQSDKAERFAHEILLFIKPSSAVGEML